MRKQNGYVQLNNCFFSGDTSGNRFQLILCRDIMRRLNARKREIEGSGFFNLIEHSLVTRIIPYSPGRYIKLLKTFPDHSVEKIRDREAFFNEIRELIKTGNGSVDVEVVTNLEIVGKKTG